MLPFVSIFIISALVVRTGSVVVKLSLVDASSTSGLGLTDRTACGISGPTSCHNTSAQSDLCCFEAPGGLLAQTQFWDTNPVTGPVNSWTIHGLWPDHCDGTFSQNCDPSRDYTNIGTILQNAGRTDLFNFMTNYMQSNSESNEAFWEHEWNTHGTCLSTLQPACFPPGSPAGTDAVYYFDRIVSLFQSLPTYQWLANAGITPSSSTTHTRSEITSALKAQSGYTPGIYCSNSAMYQIYWYFNLKGSVIDGTFVPIDAPSPGNCPSTGIKYLPKSGGTTALVSTPTATATATSSSSTVTNIPIRGYLRDSSGIGCLLTKGTWSSSTQTCATIAFTASGGSVKFRTSRGTCGVSGGAITCGTSVSSIFGATTSGGKILLTYADSPLFSADGTPIGAVVETVYTGGSHSVEFQLVISSS